MKAGMSSLQEFAAEIERRAAAKEDLIANTKAVALVPFTDGRIDLTVGDKQYGINKIGHAQLAEAAGIPKAYYDKMLAEQPKLLTDNVNTWFKSIDEPRLFRTLDKKVRAVRSDKFRTDLEYEDLANEILPVLLELDVAIMSFQLTETRMYIKAVDKRVERELQAIGGNFGDKQHNIVRMLSPAITISDSEVGFGSASVRGGVYDGFCSNLATFGERSVRKYHVGARHSLGDEVYSMLSNDTKQKTAVATIAQLRDVVKVAFDKAKFDSLCDKIEGTTTQKIEGDLVKVVKLTGTKLGLSDDEGKNVLKALAAGGDLTRFGLYNAVTRASQDVEDYDRATQMEELGAKIIDLPDNDWRVIAEAA